MAFQLKISKGKSEGKVYPFSDREARIGRTPENDVIVKDGGVSRNHARVYVKGGKHFVEDLKSSNGTRLNGTTIAGPKELKTGDSLTIGDVTFDFSIVGAAQDSLSDESEDGEAAADDGEEAREATPPPRRPAPRKRPAKEEEDDDEPPARQAVDVEDEEDPDYGETVPKVATEEPGEDHTRKVEVRRRPTSSGSPKNETLPVRASPRAAAASAKDETLPAKSSRPSAGVARAAPESAAEKARRRREASESVVGKVAFAFSELSAVGKGVTVALLGLALIGGAAGLYVNLRGDGPVARGPEPSKLGSGRVADSFGLGPGVMWSRPDMKVFTFDLNTATKAVAVLRYQAANISQDEVVITVNGVEQGMVPPDTLDTETRELELVLRPANLKQRESNSLMFDNTKNPPGNEEWKIWNLGLEIVPIPEVSPEELLRLAEKDTKKAQEFYELRDVGPDNLFKAWKSYRDAWLTLEGVTEKPELYDLVRAQMKIITPELDRKCRMMMLDAQRFIELKKPKKARAVLDDVSRYFPTREHRCQAMAREKLNEYEL